MFYTQTYNTVPVWCNAEEHCRIWNFKRGFRVRFPSAAEKLKRLVGRHTGIVADLSSGSVLSVWEGREKELMNRPYIVESNHENKECEGPARGSPSGERYHLKKKKKVPIIAPSGVRTRDTKARGLTTYPLHHTTLQQQKMDCASNPGL